MSQPTKASAAAPAAPVVAPPDAPSPVAVPAPVYRSGSDIATDIIGQASAFLRAAAPGKSADASGVTVDGLKALAVAVVFPSKLGEDYGTPSLNKTGGIVASPARRLALSAAFAQAEPAHAMEAGGFVNNILRKAGRAPDCLPFTRADKSDTNTGKQSITLSPKWAAVKGDKASGM